MSKNYSENYKNLHTAFLSIKESFDKLDDIPEDLLNVKKKLLAIDLPEQPSSEEGLSGIKNNLEKIQDVLNTIPEKYTMENLKQSAIGAMTPLMLNVDRYKLDIKSTINDLIHDKAQQYLENHSESIDYAIIKQIDEISNKVIYSTSSIRDNIIKAIDKVHKIELKPGIEKQVAILELLENFYNDCSFLYEGKELEDTFVEALSFVYKSDDKSLQGFVEEIYADYFA